MSTDPAEISGRQLSPPRPSECARYRKRRRQGMQHVRIALHVTDIDALVRMRLLKEEQRRDPEVLQAAILSLVYRACEEAT